MNTEQKKAEAELHKYELIFNNAGWGMAIVEPDTHLISYANSVFAQMHGYQQGEMIGMNLTDSFAPESRTELPALASAAHHSGHLTYESLHQRKDGSTFPCLTDVTAFKDAAGRVLFHAATFKDITARKHSESENTRLLAEGIAARNEAIASRELLHSIFERVNDGFIALDNNWCYTYVNARATKMLQREKPEDLIGKHIWTEYPEGINQPFHQAYLQAFTSQQPVIFEQHYAPWNQWFENRVYPSADGLTIYFTEISERKQAELIAQDLRDQLIQSTKMEAVGQLTAGIAHDFNNILGAILGYTELTELAIADDAAETAAPYLTSIRKAGNRAKDMITQMLTFSRISADPNEDIPVIDLAVIVKEVTALLRSSIPSTIDLNYHLPSANIRAAIHAVHLHQILVNLGINARDAIPDYGKIDITLSTCHSKDAFCDACVRRFNGDYAQLSVRDTGGGISRETINKIFDPFFTTKDIGKGTGMGLSVVHGLVHSVGGHIQLESNTSGTTFNILLPLTKTKSATTSERTNNSTMSPTLLRNARLMVVDDEAEVGKMLQELLSMCGAQVSLFKNSKQALARFMENPDAFDLIVTDETMPELTGTHLADQVLKIKPAFPIILLTGYSEHIDAAAAAKHGLAGFFYKPVRMNDLLEKIQNIFQT